LLVEIVVKNLKSGYNAPGIPSGEIPSGSPDKLPANIQNAYWFQGFNAVSWQICLGSPMILFARELGAPAVVLGLLAGLSPLTSMLQLFVAPHAERIGYRNLMVKGWTSRVMTLIFLALLPLAVGWLPNPYIIGLLVLIMTAFTTLRGIATCSWLPWTTSLVPRSLRGYYLSRDRTFVNVASVAALAVSGFFLFDHSGMKAYTIVFGISFVGGAASLYFLNRVPDPPLAAEVKQKQRVQWLTLLRDNAFARLLVFSMTVQTFVASIATFVIVFVRDQVQLQDGTILWLTAGSALLGTLAMRLLRHRVDRFGSRPFLGITFLWWVVYFLTWFLLAAHLVDQPLVVAPALMLMAGFFGATYDLALTRLLMNTVGDRTHSTEYFALHSALISLMMGISPILWGLLLDTLRGMQFTIGGMELGGFAVFFALQWCGLGFVLLAYSQVSEASSTSTGSLLYRAFVTVPSQRLTQLTGRNR
jgi:MFS family permease